jgi:alpha-L-fucosidase
MLVYPMDEIILKNMADKVKYVQLLNDASEVQFSAGTGEAANDLNLSLPILKPPVEIPVLEVFLK